MNTDKVQNIVENILTKTDLSVVNQHQGLTWSDQFKAVLNLIPDWNKKYSQLFPMRIVA